MTHPNAFRLETEIPHCRTIWIGVLEGTWTEMGIQYGERAGKDIARNFDSFWQNMIATGDDKWKQGKDDQEDQIPY